jgi:hypothetical protein
MSCIWSSNLIVPAYFISVKFLQSFMFKSFGHNKHKIGILLAIFNMATKSAT